MNLKEIDLPQFTSFTTEIESFNKTTLVEIESILLLIILIIDVPFLYGVYKHGKAYKNAHPAFYSLSRTNIKSDQSIDCDIILYIVSINLQQQIESNQLWLFDSTPEHNRTIQLSDDFLLMNNDSCNF